MKFFNATKKIEITGRLEVAERFFDRLKGLMFRKTLDDDCGLLIKRCDGIHMFFMKFPIDAVFLKTVRSAGGKDAYRVVRVIDCLKPWRVSPYVYEADSVLEIKAGKSKNNISVNDLLEVI